MADVTGNSYLPIDRTVYTTGVVTGNSYLPTDRTVYTKAVGTGNSYLPTDRTVYSIVQELVTFPQTG